MRSLILSYRLISDTHSLSSAGWTVVIGVTGAQFYSGLPVGVTGTTFYSGRRLSVTGAQSQSGLAYGGAGAHLYSSGV